MAVSDFEHQDLMIELNISAKEDAVIKLFRNDKKILLREVFIPANRSESIILDDFFRNEVNKNDLDDDSYMLEKCYQIESSGEVSVNLINYFEFSSEATTLLPTNSWGKRYFHNSYWNDIRRGNRRNTGFLILSKENDTKVNIKLNGRSNNQNYSINNQYKLGDEFQIELQENMVYLVEAEGSQSQSIDLSGSEISSDKEIAVISYQQRTGIPASFNSGEDYLLEMFPPADAWSNEYYTLEFDRNGEGDFFRILASEDDTEINVSIYDKNNLTLINDFDFSLDEGEFADNNPDENGIAGVIHWISDKPILIVQYSYSEEFDNAENHDPTMVYAVSPNQLTNQIVTKTPLQNIFPRNRMNLFVRNINENIGDLQSVEYNGTPIYLIDDGFLNRRIPGTDCYFTTLDVSNLNTTNIVGNIPFGAVLYGSREFDSYAMLVGGNFEILNKVDTIPPAISITELCTDFIIESNEINLLESAIDTVYNFQSGLADISVENLNNMIFNRVDNNLSVIDFNLPATAEVIALDSAGNSSRELIQFDPIIEKIELMSEINKDQFKPGERLSLKIKLDNIAGVSMDSIYLKIKYPTKALLFLKNEIENEIKQIDNHTEINLNTTNLMDSVLVLDFQTLLWEEDHFELELILDYNEDCIELTPDIIEIKYTDCIYDLRAISSSGFNNDLNINKINNNVIINIESAFKQGAVLEIFNITGSSVYSTNINLNEGQNDFIIENKQFRKGMYFIKVEGRLISKTGKFIN